MSPIDIMTTAEEQSALCSDINGFKSAWDKIQTRAVSTARSKGWYDDDWSIDRSLCLIHAEVAEVTEALRAGNPVDSKCLEYSAAEVELADVIIRIMDLAHRMDWNIPGAVSAKMEFNKTRPYKHGKLY